MSRNLLIVLAYDLGLFCALVLWLQLDSGRMGAAGNFIPLGLVWLAVWAGKRMQKIVAGFSQRQKKLRFNFTAALFVLLFVVVLRWMIRVNNGAAWGIGSMGVIILAALLYGEWDRLQDELKKPPAPQEGVALD